MMKAVHRIVRSLTSSQTSKPICIVGCRKFSDGCDRIVDDGAILPVLIVGAGPVGLVLSILLTKLGVRCAILEKNKAFSKHPQAHFINNRSMEVFRKLDGLAGEIQSGQPPLDLWRKFIYCTSLSGKILGSVDHIQPQDLEQSVSPVFVAHFSQYKLTQLLLKRLENLDFHIQSRKVPDGVRPVKEKEILMGHELLSICASENCLNVKASFHEEGKCMEKIIRCAFLVGADGAGSTVRKLSGIEMIGESDLQKLVSVHFISKDLGDYLIKERPGMLFFIFNTEAIGVLVAHDLRQGEFVLQMCETLISKLVGQELEDINVMDIKPWIMHAEVADKFMSLHERVIIAGDAAHRFPPAGGFGMNTGIQDAHNLAWKLASVFNGVAPTKLLKTYETERKPVATSNTQLSVQNFRAAMAVPSALGLDPKIATSVHRIINDGIGSVLPSGLQRLILDGVFSIGRAQVVETVLNDKNPLGASRLAKLNQVFEDGKSLQLQFPAEDLGFRYLRGALVGGGDTSTEPPSGRRRVYIPSAEPGARLPHMTVRTLSNGTNEGILSTHDLLSGNKVEFLLIISPLEGSYNLARATINIAKKFKVTVKVGVVWLSGDNTDKGSGKVRNSSEFLPPATFVDVVEEKNSSTSQSWWEICQMSDRGAILVRPDEHIAWCSKSGDVGDPVAEMEKVFSIVLGFV